MKIYTIQPTWIVNRLRSGKPYYAWLSRADDMAPRAYEWMREQYVQRVKPLPRGRALVWCWPEKPDFRKYHVYQKGLSCLTLEIDSSRVLWSDFDLWHTPLNGGAIGAEELWRDDAAWNAFHDWYDEQGQAAKEDTWDQVFQVAHGASVQGVFDCIRPEDLRAARLLKKRNALRVWAPGRTG